ncbi:MAG: carbohydrate binding family 9 domain-containing protein [Bacteroidales bacterium]|nr:carbohydrate binding family 9 domain-containing protein [Bacteroidales bacterium]
MRIFTFLLGISCPFVISIAGDVNNKTSFQKRTYHTERISKNVPVIDGNLTDECWDLGEWSLNFVQQKPVEGGFPSQNTQMKVLYDDENIYVAIRAFEKEMDKLHRFKGRKDEFSGDIVGICFDSYFDHRTGFEFNLTAGGAQIDLIMTNEGIDMNWNPVWYGSVGMEDSAWVAEMKIPLSQLRFSSNKEQVWGLHAWRWINRNQEEVQWNLIPRQNSGVIYNFGELHGIEDIPNRRNKEISPYISAKSLRNKPEEGNPFETGKKVLLV